MDRECPSKVIVSIGLAGVVSVLNLESWNDAVIGALEGINASCCGDALAGGRHVEDEELFLLEIF